MQWNSITNLNIAIALSTPTYNRTYTDRVNFDHTRYNNIYMHLIMI